MITVNEELVAIRYFAEECGYEVGQWYLGTSLASHMSAEVYAHIFYKGKIVCSLQINKGNVVLRNIDNGHVYFRCALVDPKCFGGMKGVFDEWTSGFRIMYG